MKPSSLPRHSAEIRRLAVQRFLEGNTANEVAKFLGVSVRSVRRWAAAVRARGWEAMDSGSSPGRPPKLSPQQTREVLEYLQQPPQAFGFDTSRWTAPRLASVIADRLGVQFNPGYLSDWLRKQAITPQLPQPVALEQDPDEIQRWLTQEWAPIKKGRTASAQPSHSQMNADSRWNRSAAGPSPRAGRRRRCARGRGTATR